MMRFLGNTTFRLGMMRNRGFSSTATATATGLVTRKVVEYWYKGAVCSVGFVLGGLTSSPVGETTLRDEQWIRENVQRLDEREARLVAIEQEYGVNH